LREQYGPVDLALLPIGAYDPRWFMAPQHTDPAEAVAIMHDLEARRALGIHWGTFKLTDEPREDPLVQLAAALAAAGAEPERFLALHPGQVVDCHDPAPGQRAAPAEKAGDRQQRYP